MRSTGCSWWSAVVMCVNGHRKGRQSTAQHRGLDNSEQAKSVHAKELLLRLTPTHSGSSTLATVTV